MDQIKFWHCKKCDNLFYTAYGSGVTPHCCGEEMESLEAKTADKATEKHVPVIHRKGKNVDVVVGSTLHPMTEEHWIQAITLVQGNEVRIHSLKTSDEPKAVFENVEGEFTVCEYCNKHGLWKAESKDAES